MTLQKWLLVRKIASDKFNSRKQEWGDLQLLDDEPFYHKRLEETIMVLMDRIEVLEKQWAEVQGLFDLSSETNTAPTPESHETVV